MSYLKYKGYLGTIEPDLETGELFESCIYP